MRTILYSVPASPQQRNIWFHSMFHSVSYWNFISAKRFAGEINLAVLKAALDQVLKLHGSLRTTFVSNDGELFQVINDNLEVDQDLFNVEHVDRVLLHGRFSEKAQDLLSTAFDPEHDLLFRLRVLISKDEYYLIGVFNHLIVDATAINLFWKDLIKYYNLIKSSDTMDAAGEKERRQYHEFSTDQASYLSSDKFKKAKQVWMNEMRLNFNELQALHYRTRSKALSKEIEVALPAELAGAARLYAMKNKKIFSSLFLTAYFILLHKYSGQQQLSIGNVTSGRERRRDEEVIGTFANRIIHHQYVNEKEALAAFLDQVNNDLMVNLKADHELPYDELVRALKFNDKSYSESLIRILFNFMKVVDKGDSLDGMKSLPLEFDGETQHQEMQFDLKLMVVDSIEEVRIKLTLACDGVFVDACQFLLDSYVYILGELLNAPGNKIKDIDLFAASAQYQTLSSQARWFHSISQPFTKIHSFQGQSYAANGQANKKPVSGEIDAGYYGLFRSRYGSSKASGIIAITAMVAVLLDRYTEQEDYVLGLQLGHKVVLPVRIDSAGHETFGQLFTRLSGLLIPIVNDPDAAFALLDAAKKAKINFVLSFDTDAHRTAPQGDFIWSFGDISNDILSYQIDDSPGLFSEKTLERFAVDLRTLFRQVMTFPGQKLKEHSLLTDDDRRQLIAHLDNTEVAYPTSKTLVNLFEEQLQLRADHIALVFGEEQLSYRELNQRSNQLADYLRVNYKIRPDDLVAVMLERSVEMIIAMLAILKSGGAYVPIDPEYPQERIDFIAEDSACRVVIDKKVFSAFAAVADQYRVENPSPVNKPEDLCYVIYTSGTTGTPKGVLIEHRNVVCLLKNDACLFDFDEQDVWTMFHSACFDFSVWEIYGALLFGGKLIMVPALVTKSPAAYVDLLVKEGVSVLNQTPSSFYNIIEEVASRTDCELKLRYVIFGGEALAPGRLKKFNDRYSDTRLINMYGITETTVHVTYKEIGTTEMESGISNIGLPLPVTSCYVLDADMNFVPIGVPGILYVGGPGVGRGYLNREELTKERFITDPFMTGGRLYYSGDQVRVLENFELEYLGRIDEQVKVRGYRIELGEIEAVLRQYPGIENVVVLAKEEENGLKELVAYLVGQNNDDLGDLRTFLGSRLPAYMIPAKLVRTDEIPLTGNGKIDKKSLMAIVGEEIRTGEEYVAPKNQIEETLLNIWTEILSIDKSRISVTDDFFDLGGDSIKVLPVVAKLKAKLNVSIPIDVVYKNHTIEKISNYIIENRHDIYLETALENEQRIAVKTAFDEIRKQFISSGLIVEESTEDVFPMSDIERGMVFESILNKDLGVYHDQFAYQMAIVRFDREIYQQAMELLVRKHAILRTSFKLDTPFGDVQIVEKEVDVKVDFEDLSPVPEQEQQRLVSAYMELELDTYFEISMAPLWRMKVFQVSETEIILVWQFHHAIFDGWSNSLFIAELKKVYEELLVNNAYRPEKLRSDYKEFVIDQLLVRRNQKVKSFWLKKLDKWERLDLFTWKDTYDEYSASFGSEYLSLLKKKATELGASVKEISLTAYLYTLGLLSQSDDLLIGLITNSRHNAADSDRILGCFLNSVPFRMEMGKILNFEELLKAVQTRVNELKYNEKLSVSEIADLHKSSRRTENPFFDVIFNFVDFYAGYQQETGSVKAARTIDHLLSRERTNTWLDLTVNATGGALSLTAVLKKELKCGFSAERVVGLCKQTLDFLLYAPDVPIKECQFITESDLALLMRNLDTTAVAYPDDKTLVDLFEAQVLLSPDEVAVSIGKQQLSYRELNARANQLANYLRTNYDIVPDDLVSIRLGRSIEIIVAMLAVLKSGGAYVPIDPDYPEDRIAFIVADSKCRVMIDEDALIKFSAEADQYSSDNLPKRNGPDDLCYVIYTSGTTGNPKGALIEHRNVVCLLKNDAFFYDINSGDAWTLFHSCCFDISVWEIYGALLWGAKLVVVPAMVAKSPSAFVDLLVEEGVTVLNQTPSSFYNIIAEIESRDVCDLKLRYVICGGESLAAGKLKGFSKRYPDTKLINMYGITETSVFSTYKEIGAEEMESDVSNIGKSIPLTSCYVLDKEMNMTPIGIPGVLYIGGPGVGRGYLNREDLTKARFKDNPFRKGERLYDSGDRVSVLDNFELEYLGRVDEQVKIRGYRIEPGEIEAVLRQYPGIEKVAVLAKAGQDHELELVAYIYGQYNADLGALRKFLGAGLPAYMVPAAFVKVDEIPLTKNGKVDKKALLAIEGAELGTAEEYVAPRNEIEERLVNIWSEVLGIQADKIGVTDDFFDLGGNSFKALKVYSQSKLSSGPGVIYRNSTIEKYARLFEEEPAGKIF